MVELSFPKFLVIMLSIRIHLGYKLVQLHVELVGNISCSLYRAMFQSCCCKMVSRSNLLPVISDEMLKAVYFFIQLRYTLNANKT